MMKRQMKITKCPNVEEIQSLIHSLLFIFFKDLIDDKIW